MFKELQELQRKQQLQDLCNNRSQNYVHQLSSLKQASGVQFSHPVNEKSVQDSPQMCTFGEIPVNLLTKNQSTFDGSVISQRYNFSSDQISTPDGSIVSNQVNNNSSQVRAGGFNSGSLSGNCPLQGFIMHKNASFPETEKRGNNGASLDPLEQKILYSTDDKSWESAFRRIAKMNAGEFKKTVEMPSTQSGRWSALMQSAAAETSTSDVGVQEEWSVVSFQNTEPLNDRGKLQNDWVDRNLQNASSPSSEPEYQPTRETHRIQESLRSVKKCPGEHKEHSNNDVHNPSSNFSGHEFRGTFWSEGSTSDHVPCIQKNYNQVNQLNSHGYSVKTEDMAHVAVSNGESVTASRESMSELLNKDNFITHEHEFKRKHNLEANAAESGPSITDRHEEAFNQLDVKKKTPSFPDRDIGPFRHSLNQNYQNYPPPENDNVNNQQLIANARKLLLSGLQSGVNDRVKHDTHALSQLGAFWSGKPSSMSHNHNYQNNTLNRPTSSNDTSNLTYQSHISSQMASSWFKRYETLMNGQSLPMYDARDQNNAPQTFDEMTRGMLQENRLIMQANLANASEGRGLSKQLNPACVFPSDVTCQKMAVSIPKKRTFSAIDMVSWHKEVNCGKSRLQDISTAEYLWAEVKPDEANNEADIVDEMLPLSRAKRRLISTTQLMQQVFRPAPVIILCSDASPNFDCVTYFTARLALGDACSLTYTSNMSIDELQSSKRAQGCKFSKVVEAIIDRMKKVEADLSGLHKSLSFVDIKVESHELEKFSVINRFAKFHLRAQSVNVDPASSSRPTTLPKGNLQRYVVPLPMPKIVPEGQECLSL